MCSHVCACTCMGVCGCECECSCACTCVSVFVCVCVCVHVCVHVCVCVCICVCVCVCVCVQRKNQVAKSFGADWPVGVICTAHHFHKLRNMDQLGFVLHSERCLKREGDISCLQPILMSATKLFKAKLSVHARSLFSHHLSCFLIHTLTEVSVSCHMAISGNDLILLRWLCHSKPLTVFTPHLLWLKECYRMYLWWNFVPMAR